MEQRNTENKKRNKCKITLMTVLVITLVIVLGLSVVAMIWLYQQGVDVKQFFVKPPIIQPIGLPNILNR